MGSGLSQDQELEPSGEESSKNGKQSKKGEAKANQSSKRVLLPHNCGDILKHADSPVYISATNNQEVLYTGVFLNQKRKATMRILQLLNFSMFAWLEVHGRFEAANLSPGRLYEIVFVVMLKDPAYGWEDPVNLRLTLPDGTRQERKENLMEKPRGRWIDIPVGEFKSSTEKTGEMEFSLYEYEGGKWKRGLLIKEVKIHPKA
ncbi:hypothetical protein SASPL_139613 [Salvia splendens]|uniref:Protein PHLOEM PROTEIN 2-LIKE A1 n=1 Tax=Salvia splendens TaxID=180675 RepID=A0A8X8ZB61_SALSN|nr:hypothetical protein SASPL_139613 [Salvia splendens]